MAERGRRDGGRVRRLWPLSWLAMAIAPLQGPAADGRADTQAQVEIHALLDGLATSSCRFQRNGAWYDGERARAHLQRKYAYLQRRGLVVDAEAFIEHAASRSSVSGRDYRVACPGQPERDASPWFLDRLQQLRRARGAAP